MNSLLFFCGFFALVLLQVNAESNEEKLAAVRAKCAAKNGMNKAEISRDKSPTFLDNPKTGCYTACLTEELQLFEEGNSIDGERLISYLRPEVREQFRPLILKCVEVAANGPDRCEVAYRGVKCAKEENESIYTRLSIFDDVN